MPARLSAFHQALVLVRATGLFLKVKTNFGCNPCRRCKTRIASLFSGTTIALRDFEAEASIQPAQLCFVLFDSRLVFSFP